METTLEGRFLRVRPDNGKVSVTVTIPGLEIREVSLEPHEAQKLGCDLIGSARLSLAGMDDMNERPMMANAKAPERPPSPDYQHGT